MAKNTFLEQAALAGTSIGILMRQAYAKTLDAELSAFREDYIRKMDERLTDFRKKVLANTVLKTVDGADGQTVVVQFACSLDSIRKECGL